MKVWKYVVIFTGMSMLLTLSGAQTPLTSLFNALGIAFESGTGFTSVTLSFSAFFDFLFGTTAGILTTIAAVTATIATGFFTRAKPENLILVPFITGALVLFVSSLNSVIQTAIAGGQGWITSIILLIVTPLGIGFITSMAEFFRGTD